MGSSIGIDIVVVISKDLTSATVAPFFFRQLYPLYSVFICREDDVQ